MRGLKRRLLIAMALLASMSAIHARAQTPRFEASLRPQIEVNNHIEFGISIDPSTVPESRGSAQLRGGRSTLSAILRSRLETGGFTFRLAFSPALDDYSGEDGFLDQFDARRLPVEGRVAYRLSDALPEVSARARIERLDRESPIYDMTEAIGELRFGQLLAYEYRQRSFDDRGSREDYLLIDSDRHQLRSAARLLFGPSNRLDVSYRVEVERYASNLSPLLYNAIREGPSFRRSDTRHGAQVTLTRVVHRNALVQAGGDLLGNRSNSPFYRFRSGAAFLIGFWSPAERRWIRAQITRSAVRFGGRTVPASRGNGETPRSDRQWQTRIGAEWALTRSLSLTGNVALIQNRTNDRRALFDFLNYTNTIYTFGLAARR